MSSVNQHIKGRILIVDDEQDICEIVTINLNHEGYYTESVLSGEEAWRRLRTTQFDLVILDVMMGGMSGFALAQQLRERSDWTPIIFLTAKGDENDKITGLNAGGDDYITKPFSIRELSARVASVLRRCLNETQENGTARTYHDGRLRIDHTTRRAMVDGEELDLTKTEYAILTLLANGQCRPFTREEILMKVWPEGGGVLARTVDVHIARLRRKMGPLASNITNRVGFGYAYIPDRGDE